MVLLDAETRQETPIAVELMVFARNFRLKIRRDECGDPVIPGRRGHLYFDAGRLCLMMIDAPPVQKNRLQALVGPDGSVWRGDVSLNRDRHRVQDVEVKGIRPSRYREAIRIAGVKRKKNSPGGSPESLAKATAAATLKRSLATGHSQTLERDGEVEAEVFPIHPKND
jgi:hypothetical protein